MALQAQRDGLAATPLPRCQGHRHRLRAGWYNEGTTPGTHARRQAAAPSQIFLQQLRRGPSADPFYRWENYSPQGEATCVGQARSPASHSVPSPRRCLNGSTFAWLPEASALSRSPVVSVCRRGRGREGVMAIAGLMGGLAKQTGFLPCAKSSRLSGSWGACRGARWEGAGIDK